MVGKLFDIPTPYMLAAGVLALLLIVMTVQGEITLLTAMTLTLLAAIVGLQVHLGSIVIKSVFSILAVIYTISIYTNIVMTVHGNIIEPFLLSLAAATVFLAVTYSSKRYNYGIRSRVLWTPILLMVIVSIKMALIMSGYSFIIVEIIGLNVLIVLLAIWIYWLNNSKKTKIIKPAIIEEKTIEKFKFIYMKNKLDVANKKWHGETFHEEKNAYPYIYNEALKANEEGLSLVIVSTANTNKIYDVGEIKLNKANTLIYLYMEAKEDDYVRDTLENFVEELSRNKK